MNTNPGNHLVQRWRAEMSRPHVVIADIRKLGTAMADEIERLEAELRVAYKLPAAMNVAMDKSGF